MRTSLMRFRVVFAVFSAVFFISAFLFPQYVQADVKNVSTYEELKREIETGTGELTINIIQDEITLEGLITIQKGSGLTTLTINGNGNTLDGGEESAFLEILKNNFSIILNDININNCYADEGAVIHVPQYDGSGQTTNIDIEINDSSFEGNTVNWGEGGVIGQWSDNSRLLINDSKYLNNTSTQEDFGSGGAIYQAGSGVYMEINHSLFKGNKALGSITGGGAIHQNADNEEYELVTMKISDSNFIENETITQGGAIYLSNNTTLIINNTLFEGNKAEEGGGAIFQKKDDTKMTITDCHFIGNSAIEDGGAIYAGAEIVVSGSHDISAEEPDSDDIKPVKGCLFQKNDAGIDGGALFYILNLTSNGCTFEGNIAESEEGAGGAIAGISYREFLDFDYEEEKYTFQQDELVGITLITDSHFIKNSARWGGVLYEEHGFGDDYGDHPVSYDENEGKYYFTINEGETIKIIDSGGNVTEITEAGTKIPFDEPTGNKITIINTEFKENEADDTGGVIYLNNLHTTVIEDSSFFEKNSANKGGCIFNVNDGELTISGESVFSENQASAEGGVLYNYGIGKVTVSGESTFTSNQAKTGGVFYNNDNGTIILSGSEFTKNSAGTTDAICYSDDNGTVSFEDNTFTGNTVGSDDGWVFSLGGNTTIKDNKFYANTDTKRDMLFKDADDDDEISGNTYRGNFLEDAFSSPKSDIPYSEDIEVKLELREVYADTVRDGNVKITINGTPYTETFAVENGTAHLKIKKSALNEGANEIKAEYVSGEYTDGKEYTEGDGYYHYQQPENLTFTINYTKEIYNVTVTSGGNGTATAEPASGKEGDKVKLTAKPDEGYHFKEWKVSGSGTLEGDTFTIGNGPAEIQAVFEKDKEPETYDVTMTSGGNGTATAEPTSGKEGDKVKLTAKPDEGYHFKEWKVSGSGTLDGDTFTIGNGPAEIQAVFEKDKESDIYTVTVTVVGNGTASANPTSGPTGTEVLLTAQPDDGWEFKEWNVIEPGGGTLQSQKAAGASETAVFIIGTADAEIQAVFEKSEEPQPPVPPRPEPVWPPFFRLNDELPKTGITGSGAFLTGKPASVNYKPVNMELQIPSLYVTSDIVTVPVTDDGYAVAWLGNDAGLLEGFALPGEGVSVIAGHNTLNAEEFGPFAAIRQLDEGERFFVRDARGKLMTYEVYANEKIGSADADALQKSALAYGNTLTLLTCEDELPEGGYASRRIVSAKYID